MGWPRGGWKGGRGGGEGGTLGRRVHNRVGHGDLVRQGGAEDAQGVWKEQLKRVKGLSPEAKARIWPWLSYMCQICTT